MNKLTALLLAAVASLAFVAGCPEDKSLKGKVDDALDRRPAEKVQDKAEDVKDAVKDATN